MQIVVSKEGVGAEIVGQVESFLAQRLIVQVIANADGSADNEVHFDDFFFFVVNQKAIFLFHKLAGFQTKGHIIQKLCVLVLLRVEEKAEVVENVVEEVVHNDAPFDRFWQN